MIKLSLTPPYTIRYVSKLSSWSDRSFHAHILHCCSCVWDLYLLPVSSCHASKCGSGLGLLLWRGIYAACSNSRHDTNLDIAFSIHIYENHFVIHSSVSILIPIGKFQYISLASAHTKPSIAFFPLVLLWQRVSACINSYWLQYERESHQIPKPQGVQTRETFGGEEKKGEGRLKTEQSNYNYLRIAVHRPSAHPSTASSPTPSLLHASAFCINYICNCELWIVNWDWGPHSGLVFLLVFSLSLSAFTCITLPPPCTPTPLSFALLALIVGLYFIAHTIL